MVAQFERGKSHEGPDSKHFGTDDALQHEIGAMHRLHTLMGDAYADDTYKKYLKETEPRSLVDPEYMLRQYDVTDKMRAILNNWLVEVRGLPPPVPHTETVCLDLP